MKIFTASITDFMDYAPSTYTVGVFSSFYNAFLALIKELNNYEEQAWVGDIDVGWIDGANSVINFTFFRNGEWHVSSTPTGTDDVVVNDETLTMWLLDDKHIISEVDKYIETHSKPL